MLYSVPPFRLKRFAFLASAAILTVRGLLVNLCFFLHAALSTATPARSASYTNALQSGLVFASISVPPVISFATKFFNAFGIVIALFKDGPDIQGGLLFGTRTFSVRVGAPAIFRICAILVSIFLTAALFYLFVTTRGWIGRSMSFSLHLTMALFFWRRSTKVDPSNLQSVTDFYMFSWKAFYAEYIFLLFAVLFALVCFEDDIPSYQFIKLTFIHTHCTGMARH